jgi:hypothetical protein
MMYETTTAVMANEDRRVGKAKRAHHSANDRENPLKRDEIRSTWPANAGALPLPGGERVGVRGDGPSIVLNPLTRIASQSDLSRRGEVNGACGPTDSSKSHPDLALAMTGSTITVIRKRRPERQRDKQEEPI